MSGDPMFPASKQLHIYGFLIGFFWFPYVKFVLPEMFFCSSLDCGCCDGMMRGLKLLPVSNNICGLWQRLMAWIFILVCFLRFLTFDLCLCCSYDTLLGFLICIVSENDFSSRTSIKMKKRNPVVTGDHSVTKLSISSYWYASYFKIAIKIKNNYFHVFILLLVCRL